MAKELPKVLWAYRTTKRFSTRETLFAMVYGTEAIIPTEIGLSTLQSNIAYMPDVNQNQLLLNLDLAEETRRIARSNQIGFISTAGLQFLCPKS